MNLTDTLPELIRSAREIITSTTGIRQFEETCSPLKAGYPLDGQIVAIIASGSRALETALLRVEQTLADVEAERRQLEAAFAALTSDDSEEPLPKPPVHHVAEEAPVVVAVTSPIPVPPEAAPEVSPVPSASRPASVEIPPAPPTVAPAGDKPGNGKKSSKKIKRCKKCHKRKKCTCDRNP